MTAQRPALPASIPALLDATVDRYADRPALVDGDTRLTWAELDQRARGFGAALVASGVAPGDRVGMWAFNSAEWVVAALGLFRAGAVLVPVNTRFKGPEAADILGRGGVKVLVTVTDFLDTDYVSMLERAREDAGGLPELKTVVVARGPAPDGTVPWGEFLARATSGACAEVDQRSAALSVDDLSDILFTSGTTGRPKGVLMTHGRTLGVATDWVEMVGMEADDRYLMVNPYFHMFGLKAGILACVAAGATMLPEPVYDVERALGRIAAEKVTVFPGAPTLYQMMLDHPDRDSFDLTSLRAGTIGAADIPVELIRRIFAELPYQVMVSGYGLTEAGTASGTRPDDAPATIATTVGRARPGFEARVVAAGAGAADTGPIADHGRDVSDSHGVAADDVTEEPTLRDVPVGETGEILLRSPTVMVGYLDDPGATAEVLTPDGWLRTGDLGVLDAEGNLSIVGRLKDMFTVGGFNVYPAEVENTLLRHPDVRQATVIGIPDGRLGEVGMAFLVVGSGERPDDQVADEVLAWCREQMANFKVPRKVEILDELPVNATGKVVKDDLRARVTPDWEAPSDIQFS